MPHQAKLSTPTPTATTPTARPYNASADCTKLCWVPPAQLRSTLRLRLRLSARYVSTLRPFGPPLVSTLQPEGCRLSARFGLLGLAFSQSSGSGTASPATHLPHVSVLRVRRGRAAALLSNNESRRHEALPTSEGLMP